MSSALSLLSPITKKPYPPVPTRQEALGGFMKFQGGNLVESPVYGRMPWWDSCLTWCDQATRQAAYAVKHAAQETHCIVEIPNGKPLYDEGGQFYSPDKFGPLDWTHGMTTLAGSPFSAMIDEVITNGFRYIIAMDEDPTASKQIVQMVMRELTLQQLSYGFTMPGYDGVFYGWEVPDIINWANLARLIKPGCYLGIEFNTGHIPLGNGPSDYLPLGPMDGYDVILGEFQSFVPGNGSAGGQVWQIVGRCVKPYNWPPDEPWDADGHPPPFYLVPNSRGSRAFWAFETDDPYQWVRLNPYDDAAVNAERASMDGMRQYFRELGCSYVG